MSSFARPAMPKVGNTSGVLKSAKQSAAAVAKRIAQEQLETLRTAKTQIGLPSSEKMFQNQEVAPQAVDQPSAPAESHEAMTARLNTESKRLLENLEAELAQIRQKNQYEQMQKQKQEEQEKIAQTQQSQNAIKEAPTLLGKMRKAIGGMGAKVKGMAGKREKGKQVSG